MPEAATHWTRIVGDGLVYDSPCILKTIIFWPDAAGDYVDIYDGRDASTGNKFCRIEADIDETHIINLGNGVTFERGIYIDGIDSAVETTVTFIPTVPVS